MPRALGFTEPLVQLLLPSETKPGEGMHNPMSKPCTFPVGSCWPVRSLLGHLAKEVTATAEVRSLSGTMWTGILESGVQPCPWDTLKPDTSTRP